MKLEFFKKSENSRESSLRTLLLTSALPDLNVRRAGRGLRRFLFFIELFAIVLGLIVGPIANALQMQLNNDLELRSSVAESRLRQIGLLKSGSIVDVPNEFAVKGKDGKPDSELTLNNWLSKAGFAQAKIEGPIGDAKNDFFFPIHVIKEAPGSDVAHLEKDGTYYVALRSLLQNKDGVIVTEGDSPVYPPSDFKVLVAKSRGRAATPAAEPPAPPAETIPAPAPAAQDVTAPPADPTQLEGQNGCPTGTCSVVQEPQFQKLIDLLSAPLRNVDDTRDGYAARTNFGLRSVGSNFAKTCGMSIRTFIPELIRQAKASDIPPEFMLSMMMQESSGDCHAVNHESNKTVSVGLFQVNSNSSTMPRCTDVQKQAIRGLKPASVQTGPRCLENPAVNLSEAIRILKAKMKTITSPRLNAGAQQFTGFDPKSMMVNGKYTTDAWRLAFTAYNGGERWVLQAKSDLEAFNKKQGTHLQANNWETMRVFFMRNWLHRDPRAPASQDAQTADPRVALFGNQIEGRNKQATRANLAWTENIIPRDSKYRQTDSPNMTEAWRQAIADKF